MIDMATDLARLRTDMTSASSTIDKAMKRADASIASVKKSLMGLAAGFGVSLTVGGIVSKIISETKSAEQAQSQLAAVLRSTGEAAGWSRERLNEMAEQMSKRSVLSVTQINEAQTRLLSYSGVVGKQFPQAMQAAIDMSTRMGMDVTQAAELVGKALDSPKDGLTALSKQGFRFTEDQKALVQRLQETGQAAQAQEVILAALESSYGGAAQAARDTFGGAINALQNQIGQLLTGKDGSLDEAKVAVNNLTNQLASRETVEAFQKLIKLVFDLTTGLVQCVTAFSQLAGQPSKIKILLGIDGLDESVKNSEAITVAWKKLVKQAEEVQVQLKNDPSNLTLQKRLADIKRGLRDLQDVGAKSTERALGVIGQPPTAAPKAPKIDMPAAQAGIGEAEAARRRKEAEAEAERRRRAGIALGEQQAKQAQTYLQALHEQAEQVKEMTAVQRVDYDILVGKVRLTAQQKALAYDYARRADEAKQAEQARKYLDGLQDQLAKTQEMTAYEQMLYDILRGKVSLYGEQLDKATALTKQIDAVKEAEKQREATLDRMNRQHAIANDLLAKQQGYQAQLAAYGMGARAAQDLQGAIQIQQQNAQQLLQLDQLRQTLLLRAKDDAERGKINDNYQQQVSELQGALQAQLAMYSDYTAQRKALEADWRKGALAGLQTYAEEAGNVYAQMQGLVTNSFRGMEDALVKFATTGKFEFKNFAESLMSDIMRIYVKSQFLGPLANAMSQSSGGGFWTNLLGSVVSGIVGGGVSAGTSTSSSTYSLTNSASSMGLKVGGYHLGGTVGVEPTFMRVVDSAVFNGAPRFHTGIGPGERPAIITDDESVLTPGQMRALAPAGKGGNVQVNVYNNASGTKATASESQGPDGKRLVNVLIERVSGQIAGDIASGTGPITGALAGRYGLRPSMV